jgi:hypothetical protein
MGETRIEIVGGIVMVAGRQLDDRTVASSDLLAWARAKLFAKHTETQPNIRLPLANMQSDRSPGFHRIVDLSALSPQSEGRFVHLPSDARPQRLKSHSIALRQGLSLVRRLD